MQLDNETEERLRSTLWFHTGQAVDAIAIQQGVNTTQYFIGGLSEMIWAQVEVVAKDLEGFAKHGGRKVINVDDVLLLGRRNDSLYTVMKQTADALKEEAAK